MKINSRRIKYDMITTWFEKWHLTGMDFSSQPDAKKPQFTVPRTLGGGLVYNGGHAYETLLLLAAIRATAQCQISGGITNGVNYNIF